MLGKKSRPIIGKLSDLLVSGNKTRFLNPIIPCSSPKSLKRYDVGGVGLKIVAALDKSSFTDCCNQRICISNLNRSNAIDINYGKEYDRFGGGRVDDSEEDYTYVISHGDGKSSTKVYYNGDELRKKITATTTTTGHDRNGFDDVKETPEEDFIYLSSGFLSCCHLCRKKLHGKDIYMYRGEKGFCSAECRSRQIMMDEKKEFCRSKVSSRSAKVSTSLYNNTSQIFSIGILEI